MRRGRLTSGARPKRGDTMAAKNSSKKPSLTLLTLSLFAIATVAPATHSVARDASATTLELSAQANNDPNADKPKGRPKPKVQPRQNIQNQQLKVQQQQQPQFQKKVIIKQNNPVNVQQNIQVKKKVIVVNPNGQKKFVGQPKVFKPAHNNLVYKFKLKGANQAFVSGKNYSVYRNNYRVRRNGRFYTFVGLGLLAPLAIGGTAYYAYAYLNVPEDYCSGLTEDGCEMVYREIDTVEGGELEQCTAYCPWQ
jgi:hypothetical protein